MIGRPIEELALGDAAELVRPVTAGAVREFVAASGDRNPLHSDPAFAAETRFGEIIAPGMFTGALVSAVIGTRLPGPGTVYVSQSLRFLRPVRVGDVVTARVEVVEVDPDRRRVRLRTRCRNGRGEDVLDGEAWVIPPARRIDYQPATPVREPAWPLLAAPAALAFALAAAWRAGGLALARHALELARPGPRSVPGRFAG